MQVPPEEKIAVKYHGVARGMPQTAKRAGLGTRLLTTKRGRSFFDLSLASIRRDPKADVFRVLIFYEVEGAFTIR
jgi:hypothetical protein